MSSSAAIAAAAATPEVEEAKLSSEEAADEEEEVKEFEEDFQQQDSNGVSEPALATALPMTSPTLSKSWSIASAHVPIYTGGNVVPCHMHPDDGHVRVINDETSVHKLAQPQQTSIPCLLLPVNGDVAVVDAQRGVKLGSVRSGSNQAMIHSNRGEEDDDGIDADAITAYALAANEKVLITCTQNQLLRQYTCHAVTTKTDHDDEMEEDEKNDTGKPSGISATSWVSVELVKTWGRSGHSLPVTLMEFHSSGVFLATASVDGTVRIWDVRAEHTTHIFRPLAGGSGGGSGRLSVTAVQWLHDSTHLVIAIGRDDGSIVIHDLRDLDMNNVVVLRDHLSAVTCMDWWCSDGTHADNSLPVDANMSYPSMFVTASRDAVLNFWSIEHNSKQTKFHKGRQPKKSTIEISTHVYKRHQTIPLYEQVEGMVLIPNLDESNAVMVATAGSKGIVRLWKAYQADDGDISEPALISEQPASQAYGEARGGYLDLAYTRGNYSTSMSGQHDQLIVADAEHCLSLLSLDRSAEKALETERTLVGFNDEVLDLKVIPSLEHTAEHSSIVVATNSAQVRIFDLDNFSCHVLDGHSATVLCVDVSPCGRYIATSGKDKKMCIWHTESHKCVATAVGHTEAIGANALSKKVGRYDVHGKAAKNGGGAFAVTVSLDRTLKRWNLPGSVDLDSCAYSQDAEQLSLHAFVSVRAHDKDINVVSIAPNDSIIATGSQDKTVKLWRTTDLRLLGTLKGHRRGVWDCQFSPFDRVVATGSGDRSIRLWSLSDFSCVRTFQGHMASVLRVRFLNGGLQLVSSGADGLVKVWTIRNNECETTLDGHLDKVWALDVAPVGTTMITGGADSQLLVWNDTTAEAEDAKRAEREEAILMDQRLTNHLRHKEFSQALNIALSLDKPRLALKVLTAIIETDVKEGRNPITSLREYIPKWSMERLGQVLGYCREWNTRARNCDVAMLVIRAIVSVLPAEKLAGSDGVPEILAGVTPYAERHFERLDRLFSSSYLLDFALFSMGSLDDATADHADFTTWETQSKLLLPPEHVDGIVGAIIRDRGQSKNVSDDDDDDMSTVGDSDSDDEIVDQQKQDVSSSSSSDSSYSSAGEAAEEKVEATKDSANDRDSSSSDES